MQHDLLSDDCTRCAALCCMAHAFDAGPSFAIDKPAGVGCVNLAPGGLCRIHARLEAKGFGGCVRYTCNGAGQRVTQEVFDGRSWRDDPHLTRPMMMALQKARKIHDWLLLMREARKLPLSADQAAEARRIDALLTPAKRMTQAWLAETACAATERRVADFLTTLRGLVDDGGPLPRRRA